MLFEIEKATRDKIIESLNKELQSLKINLKQEKHALEELEDQEEILDEDRSKLVRELESLDQQLTTIDADCNSMDQDDDLLIAKLEQETQYLDNLLKSTDEENIQVNLDIKSVNNQNHITELDNQTLEKKLEGIENIEQQIANLQSKLSDSVDKEKHLFDENLKLLQILKVLDGEMESSSKNQKEKGEKVSTLKEQLYCERNMQSSQTRLQEFTDKLENIQNIEKRMKWIANNASTYIESESNIGNITGFDNFRNKFKKFSTELQIIQGKYQQVIKSIQALKSSINETKDLDKGQLAHSVQKLKDIDQEIESLNSHYESAIDLDRVLKTFYDFERNTESEFYKKLKALKDQHYHENINLEIMNKAKLENAEESSQYEQFTQVLYKIEDYEAQTWLHTETNVSIISKIEKDYQQTSKFIKLFYQLQFLSKAEDIEQKEQAKLAISQKLKMIQEKFSDLDKSLGQNTDNLLTLIQDAAYLKDSEFSPVKGRQSIIYGSKGDLEKERDLSIQSKLIDNQQYKIDSLVKEKDKMKKIMLQYQQRFDEMDLENCSLIKLDELIDDLNKDIDYKIEDIKEKSNTDINHEIKTLQQDAQERVQKFQDKRQILSDCKKEEKDKKQDLLKIEQLVQKLSLKIDKFEKDMKKNSAYFDQNDPNQGVIAQNTKLISEFKNSLKVLNNDIENRKSSLNSISSDINMIGDKIITIDNLKSILDNLLQMDDMKGLKQKLIHLDETVTKQQDDFDKFMQNLFGQSVFQCESKFKEAAQLLEQISKGIIELNNSLNDFEVDVKKGFHLYSNNEEILNIGKNLLDLNTQDRRNLKNLDDQKNFIRKTLHKIKSSLGEQESLKASKSMTAGQLDDYIDEIIVCIEKCKDHLNDLKGLNENLNKRVEQWNNLMFKGGASQALVEDIDKLIKDNIGQYHNLSDKVKKIDSTIVSLEAVLENIKENPDYESRKQQTEKLLDSIKECRQRKKLITTQMDQSRDIINNLSTQQEAGLNNKSIEELQQMAQSAEAQLESLQKENKTGEVLLKDLIKKRQKLGDADINENLKQRAENANAINNRIDQAQNECDDLEKILAESSKLSPNNIEQSNKEVEQIKSSIQNINNEKGELFGRIQILQDKLKSKDLNKEDPKIFIPIINEMTKLKTQVDQKDKEIQQVFKDIQMMKNKHGGLDIKQKLEKFLINQTDSNSKIQELQSINETLKDLYEEFEGYTSDSQEEGFIDRLGIEMRDIDSKLISSNDLNDKLLDKIKLELKNHQQNANKDITSQNMEQKAIVINDIEDQFSKIKGLVEECQRKINRSSKFFNSMPIKEKLGRRDQEIQELNKRIKQFENLISQLEKDVNQEINIQSQNQQADLGMLSQVNQIQDDSTTVKNNLNKNAEELFRINDILQNTLQNLQSYSHFDLLKANINIKKDILQVLQQIKETKQNFSLLKHKFDQNKQAPPPVAPLAPVVQEPYRAYKGDYVDQLLADWINHNNCPVPINRIGNGFYMFGTKKIFAKIINGKLLIRVGGGYMSIDQFMFYYGAQELNKMLAYENFDDEELDFDKALRTDENDSDIIRNFSDGKAIIGLQQFKKRLSPRPPSSMMYSPRQGSPHGQAYVQGKRSRAAKNSPSNSSSSNVMFSQGSPKNAMAGKKSPNHSSHSSFQK